MLQVLGCSGAVAALAACTRGGDDDAAGTLRYGEHRTQRVELRRPDSGGPHPVALVAHGGFWSASYDLDLMRPLVPDLVADGWAVANVGYRGVGDPGGGWPGTLDDVAAAVDRLADEPDLDLARVVAIGHSAGGHLAVWLAGRTDARVPVAGAVAQAGVLDLVAAERGGLGGGAAGRLLGGSPDQVPDRYAAASPVARVPIGAPVELVHGTGDRIVPLDQSERYRAAAEAAGDPVRLTEVPGDHFAVIDPATPAWAACRAALLRLRPA